jgi:hypothetical protein
MIPTYSFAPTVEAVTYLGARPVLADCRLDTIKIDAGPIEPVLTLRSRVAVAVHVAGQVCSRGGRASRDRLSWPGSSDYRFRPAPIPPNTMFSSSSPAGRRWTSAMSRPDPRRRRAHAALDAAAIVALGVGSPAPEPTARRNATLPRPHRGRCSHIAQ